MLQKVEPLRMELRTLEERAEKNQREAEEVETLISSLEQSIKRLEMRRDVQEQLFTGRLACLAHMASWARTSAICAKLPGSAQFVSLPCVTIAVVDGNC